MYLINPEDIRFEMRPIMPFLSGNPVQYEWIAFRWKINQIPRIEAEPVKHAHWIKQGSVFERKIFKCSNCGNFLDFSGVNAGRGYANYCPHCGAKMVEYPESGEGDRL